jgi:hypothetical protein
MEELYDSSVELCLETSSVEVEVVSDRDDMVVIDNLSGDWHSDEGVVVGGYLPSFMSRGVQTTISHDCRILGKRPRDRKLESQVDRLEAFYDA